MSADAIVQIGTAVIGLLGMLITYFVIPYIRTRTIAFWVGVAVDAAEQIYKESGMGATKKKYALEFLNKKGIKLSEADLDALIEAAVCQLNKSEVAIANLVASLTVK